jgi:hypothetical protein
MFGQSGNFQSKILILLKTSSLNSGRLQMAASAMARVGAGEMSARPLEHEPSFFFEFAQIARRGLAVSVAILHASEY